MGQQNTEILALLKRVAAQIAERQQQAFNKSTRTIPGEEPLTWNQALRENMLRPYSSPKPEYEDMLFVPADWQKREVSP